MDNSPSSKNFNFKSNEYYSNLKDYDKTPSNANLYSPTSIISKHNLNKITVNSIKSNISLKSIKSTSNNSKAKSILKETKIISSNFKGKESKNRVYSNNNAINNTNIRPSFAKLKFSTIVNTEKSNNMINASTLPMKAKKSSIINFSSLSETGKKIAKLSSLNKANTSSPNNKLKQFRDRINAKNSKLNKSDSISQNSYFLNKETKAFSENKVNKYASIISKILDLRVAMKQDYSKITLKKMKINDIKMMIISKWSQVIHLLIELDVRKSIDALRLLGEIYVEFDDYEHAKRVLLFVKYLCWNLELPFELCNSYESLGTCYKLMNEYKKAILYFKKQIEVAWMVGDYISELRAYDNIGLQYFYLSNKLKARYFHNRMLKGDIERNTLLKEKVKRKLEDKNEKIYYTEERKMKTEDMIIDNDKLKQKLQEVLTWFDTDKTTKSIQEIDLPKTCDKLNDSTESLSDITFLILNDNNENDEYSTAK